MTRSSTKRPADSSRPQSGGGANVHIVRHGETLWSIAAHELGTGATNQQIAAEVERLWHLNAATIGTGDPNVIVPGQRVRL